MADLRALLASREPLYAQAAVTVDTAGVPAERVVSAIVSSLDRP
jgi:shikimate kinase